MTAPDRPRRAPNRAATCHRARALTDRDVLVVGGGDTACEDALVLARTSARVVLVHRRDRLRASHALARRVLAHPKITVHFDTVVERFVGQDGQLTTAWLRTTRHASGGGEAPAAEGWALPVAAAFVAIGPRS